VKQSKIEHECQFICDSGAEVSIIPLSIALTKGFKIEKAIRRLELANGSKASCKGVVHVDIKVKDKVCKAECYVVEDVQSAIMGLDVLGALDVILITQNQN
jgi:hypothetical protein